MFPCCCCSTNSINDNLFTEHDAKLLEELDLIMVKLINVGATSRVYKVKDINENKFALKIIPFEIDGNIMNDIYERELKILQVLKGNKINDDIVYEYKDIKYKLGDLISKTTQSLIASYRTDNEFLIITNFYNAGDLYDLIANLKQSKFTELHAKKLALNMLQAILALHTINISHRDIKPENFVVETKKKKKKLLLVKII